MDKINLIKSFLSNRSQAVRVGDHLSDTVNTHTGCPQGCVPSPLLFSLYNDEVRSSDSKIRVMKYADDMAIIGLLNHRGSDKVYQDFIESFSVFCKNNNLSINNFSRTVTTYNCCSPSK